MFRNRLDAIARALALALALLFTASAGAAAAQNAGPQLVARDYFDGSGGQPREQALRLARLEVETSVIGATAQTTITAEFSNPTNRPLEGEFSLELPAGSAVTGYALDINGRLVDGVITPRRQALKAYEARVRRGIDPGVAEVGRDNAFRTRVFPIFPRAGRTVRLSFATPLDAGAAFTLPLATREPIGDVQIRVRAAGAAAPTVTGPGLDLRSTRAADGQLWEGRAANRPLSGALRIGPVTPTAPATVTRHASGEFFVDIADAAPVTGGQAAPVRRLRLYWDRSRSRRDDDLEAELRLLGRYLGATRPDAVDLVTFADKGPELRSFDRPSPGVLEAALRQVEYAGATSLADVLSPASMAQPDACLLFSDGTVTVDPYSVGGAPCPLLVVSSAPDADRGLLSALATTSGGEHLDLRAVSAAAALSRLMVRDARVVAVTDEAGADLQSAVLPAAPGRARVVARAPDDGSGVVVRFADGSRRSYRASTADAAAHDAPGALWAAARLAVLNASDRPDSAALLQTARRFGVPAAGLAYVVLETPRDYAQAEIEPPASLGADARDAYRRTRASLAERKQREQEGRLERVLAAWEEQKRWWRDPLARRRAAEARAAYEARFPPPPPPPPPPPMPVAAPPPPPAAPAETAAPVAEESVEQIVVTGNRVRPGASGAVQIEPPDLSRPHLRALEDAAPDRLDAVLREQERRHGTTPAFYFDVADWLHRQGRTAQARAYVLNALELPLADVRTLAITADRLSRYGDVDRAVWARERVLYLQPDLPQSRRNLALALIARAERPGASAEGRRADYTRAVELLTEVVMTAWDRSHDGIGLISLTEVNRIIPRLRQLGGRTTLDPRLIALLDVDLRVTIDWSTEATNLDLIVVEPGGERATPGFEVTANGGRVSNDISAGFGPEEYQVRRAASGEHVISVATQSTDRLDPNGPVVVRARLYRDWGRPTETVELVDLELRPGEDAGERAIGRVTLGRPTRRR